MNSRWLFFPTVGREYWGTVFVVFVLSYFLPFGSGVTKTVFYLLIFFPALFCLRRTDFLLLFRCTSFWPLFILCAYALMRSVDLMNLRETAKEMAVVFVLLAAALRLPLLQPEKVKHFSLAFIMVVITYVLLNATYQHLTHGWSLGKRLSPLFGQSKSVIFTADLLLSALTTYSWTCIKTRDLSRIFYIHILVIGVAAVFLQTRSIFPVWIVSVVLLIATQARHHGHIVKASVFTILGSGLLVWLALSLSGIADSLTARGDSYRIEIWSAYFLNTVKCGVIAGCGWGSELGFITNDGSAISHPHSMYMQHFYWGGLIGLFLLIVCITTPLTKGIRSSNYASWPLLSGSVALVFDGKSLLSLPNERWLLVLVPLAVLIGGLARSSHAGRPCVERGGDDTD